MSEVIFFLFLPLPPLHTKERWRARRTSDKYEWRMFKFRIDVFFFLFLTERVVYYLDLVVNFCSLRKFVIWSMIS